MINKLILLCALPLTIFARDFNTLPDCYRVQVGQASATSTIVEYFSLSCPLCLKLIKQEFREIYEKHVQTGEISWEFHPDPQDISTLQLMVCLEKLPQSKRWPFFWKIAQSVKAGAPGRSCFFMQELMKHYERPLPLLHDIHFLETTRAYRESYKYLKQNGIPSELPAIEQDGTSIKGLPTKNLIAKILLPRRKK
ncbi:MAG: hypothetical protein K1060chlam2_00577 [Chlamydiae bacterium]|nr:hypothetical protein [Chlamydiota bacterium]